MKLVRNGSGLEIKPGAKLLFRWSEVVRVLGWSKPAPGKRPLVNLIFEGGFVQSFPPAEINAEFV